MIDALDPLPSGVHSSPDELSSQEAARMVEWTKNDLLAGKISQAQADEIYRELGATAEQLAPDTRSPEVKALDAQFTPAKPEDYTIQYGIGQVTLTEPQKQFDANARAWLSGSEFDRSLGNSLVTTIGRVGEQTRHMTPEQLENYGATEFEKLRGVYGPKLEEKLNRAGQMIREIEAKRPGLQALLKSRGIGDNAMVASMLIQQSERYFARRGQHG